MLSKKMTVSLMSLIAILALAFSAVEEVHAQSTFAVIASDAAGSGIDASAPVAVQSNLPNLLNFFLNGGRIEVYSDANIVISEIMWGVDASLNPPTNSQWIELKNVSGAAAPSVQVGYITADGAGAVVPMAGLTLRDSVGTFNSTTGAYWDIQTRGQSGRTGTGEQAAGVTTVVDRTALISMQRVFSDTAQTMPLDGLSASGWVSSTRPALNFDRTATGERIGTPGASPLAPVLPPTPPPPPPPTTTPIAGKDDIKVTEIMVDTSDDRFPQWIELTHMGIGKVSLNGWEMVIDNAVDGDVIGGGNAITVKLDGVTLDVSKHASNTGDGQSVLVVAWSTRRHSPKLNRPGIVLDLSPQLKQDVRYQLLSYNGFRISLRPPQTGAIATFGDRVGNLDEDWELPMLEGPKRSSMIRREMSTAGAALSGEMEAGWILASATSLISGPETYYGNDEDAGTPGYDAGGPLPVELSFFRPARDKQTGQVVITWATQSELNNAGFFIKRSNQRHGDFKVINPTMIPGAGTTSEKQTYTYTDTTAQSNVVYYYQIEDVSLDGNRQLLTRGMRLRGHIGAAGKATVIWGDLKTSHE